MIYRITSPSLGKTFTTKDASKDVAWGNSYYGVTDCILEEIVEMTPEEIAAQEAAAESKRKERQEALDELIEERIHYKKQQKGL